MNRFEIKFDVTDESIHNIILKLNLVPIYEERKIHNIYFDTDDLVFFNESEEGSVPRKKIRLRSYNFSKNHNLEIKFTYNFNRKKDSYNNVDTKDLRRFLNKSGVHEKIKPVLKLNYDRKYFMCKFGRVTYDYNLKFSKINQNFFYKDTLIKNILEFKTTENKNRENFLMYSKMKNIRFSKYCYALNYLF